jgi:hypothetical protein
MNILKKVLAPLQWLEVAANRRKVYKTARVVLPALVAAGWLTTGQQDDVLTALQVLASFAVPHLAARNTR